MRLRIPWRERLLVFAAPRRPGDRGLNLWTPVHGTPRDPFGSVMITNIGSLGLEVAFAPLVPYSRVPLVIAVGALRERPTVVDHQVTVARVITLCLTVDHRLVDGVQVSRMARAVQDMFADPERELRGGRDPASRRVRLVREAPSPGFHLNWYG